MIWWLWTAFDPPIVMRFDVRGSDDIAWLGECGWTAATDNMGVGLR